METDVKLNEAFTGESRAYMTYLAFARAADKDGHRQVARLFMAVAEAEKVHALSHFKVLGKSSSTQNNLKSAIDGEVYEFTTMYPGFIRVAESESNKRAATTFKNASDVERIHSELYGEALKNLGKIEDAPYFVCPVCGNTEASEAPDRCGICGAGGDKFIRIE